MTDGTSQGLFIVVAIVIFGIFVVLAYILFEDSLSPTLANMFSDATETATKRLNGGVLLSESLFGFYNPHSGNMILDFERSYSDNGEMLPPYVGERGTFSGSQEAYVITRNQVRNSRPSEIQELNRVYVSQLRTDFDKYHFTRKEVWLNGRKMKTRSILGNNPLASYVSHFLHFEEPLVLEDGKPYTFVIRLYTDNDEYFEFSKTVILK